MPATIRIKRTTTSNRPSTLKNAELAFIEGSSILVIGTGTSGDNAASIIDIGGSGAFLGLSNSLTQTAAGSYTFSGTVNASGTFQIGGTTVSATAAQLNLLAGATANTVVNSKAVIYGASGEVAASSISTTGNATVGGNCTITGNLTVNGTTTTINSTAVSVDDINVILGDTASPTDATADGGGITLKGTTDKTFNWVDATDAWTSSEHINLLTGKAFYIAGTSVLSGTTLGSGVTSSSLTSVGTIGSGTWQGTAIAVAYGGLGLTSAVSGLLKGSGGAYSAATAGTDYLDPNSTIDGGTYS